MAIFTVGMGDFTFVGHGPMQYARKIKDWVVEGSFFPFFATHYDEPIFHHFIAYPLYASKVARVLDISNIISWWITLALIKCSTIYYLYFVSRLWNIKKLFSLTIIIFVSIGTIAADPTNYLMLFDSNNPGAFIVHSGRVIPIYIVTFLAHLTFVFYNYKIKHKEIKIKNISKLYLFLIGIGISSTSISNSMWIYGIIFICISIHLLRDSLKIIPGILHRYSKPLLYFLPFLISALLFSNFMKGTGWDLKLKFGLVVFSLTLFLLALFSSREILLNKDNMKFKFSQTGLKPFLPIIYIVIGNLIGLLFLGNIFSILMAKLIYWDTIKGTFLHAMNNPIWAIPLTLPNQALIGDFRSFDLHNKFNSSINGFVGYYGGLYLLIVGLFFYSKAIIIKKINYMQLYVLEKYMICFYCILPFLYFFMEYTSIAYPNWLKTRFVEVPVYGIIIYSLFLFNFLTTTAIKRILIIILLIFSFLPFISTGHLKKIIFNYDALLLQYQSSTKSCPTAKKITC
jgi:hypothetical protein